MVSAILVDDSHGHACLSNIPILVKILEPTSGPAGHQQCLSLYNKVLTIATGFASTCEWALYSFNNVHFVSSICSRNLPFHIVLSADPHTKGRDLIKEFTDYKCILDCIKELYDHIRSSTLTCSQLQGYLVHSHHLPNSTATTQF